jgi:hypothetical protein
MQKNGVQVPLLLDVLLLLATDPEAAYEAIKKEFN